MEIGSLEDKKNKVTFEIKGMESGIINALKNELYNDKHIKIATYSNIHPLIGIPKMIIETDGADIKDSIVKACQRLTKTNEKFLKEFVKEIR